MLRQYGLDHRSAMKIAQSRKKYWRLSNTHEVHRALTTKQLYKWGLIPLAHLQSWLTQDIEPPITEPYARWCERTNSQLMAILLLDLV
ncbi:hypothetical protein O0C63_12220 [Staphylococcus pseudintermedius]|nr:hypothetical protein [Staphylococcus pseudintermedius]MDF0052542.1 hypothetical protein [Staphylococcus pseudintermedius]MDK3837912.1 hypothetical protein [Staphylococcus pseudintermedius]MDK4062197.1 hypothetical protein [Staphylococcus pseudintermedius]